MNHPHTHPSVGRSSHGEDGSCAILETLEPRQLMAVFFAGTDLSVLRRPGPGFGLPPPAVELPRQDVRLPHPNDVGAGRLDLRGLYQGRTTVNGVIKDDLQQNLRWGGTLALPVTRGAAAPKRLTQSSRSYLE